MLVFGRGGNHYLGWSQDIVCASRGPGPASRQTDMANSHLNKQKN